MLGRLRQGLQLVNKNCESVFESLIAVKCYAWCLDVKSKRRKMARLLTGTVAKKYRY